MKCICFGWSNVFTGECFFTKYAFERFWTDLVQFSPEPSWEKGWCYEPWVLDSLNYVFVPSGANILNGSSRVPDLRGLHLVHLPRECLLIQHFYSSVGLMCIIISLMTVTAIRTVMFLNFTQNLQYPRSF